MTWPFAKPVLMSYRGRGRMSQIWKQFLPSYFVFFFLTETDWLHFTCRASFAFIYCICIFTIHLCSQKWPAWQRLWRLGAAESSDDIWRATPYMDKYAVCLITFFIYGWGEHEGAWEHRGEEWPALFNYWNRPLGVLLCLINKTGIRQ